MHTSHSVAIISNKGRSNHLAEPSEKLRFDNVRKIPMETPVM